MKKLQEADILAAVDQACREESFAFSALNSLIKSDESAVVFYGGLTPRVAYILGANEATVRRRLHGLAKRAMLLKHRGSRSQTIRWWPVGLYDRIHAKA